MSEKTKSEIEAEVANLEACKAYIPKYSAFSEDNHAIVNLQIEELRFGIDDTADEWDELSDMEKSAILEARDWKEGQVEDAPSMGWGHFKPNDKQ